MKLLGIETATEVCSVVLSVDDQLLVRRSTEPRAHARLLLPMLDELLAEGQIAVAQLDGVSFGRGPGSFTGVRIATAAAQAIAFAHDLPVYPVSNLALVAQRAFRQHTATDVLVAMDARMREVYWAHYQLQGQLMQLHGEEHVCSPSSVTRPAAQPSIAGSGWAVYSNELHAATGCDPQTADVSLPDAIDLIPHAQQMAQQGEGLAPEDASPVYLRNQVALTEAQRRSTAS